MKRTIRITVEFTQTRKRRWLKAVDSDGQVQFIRNIPREAINRERNRLAEALSATGQYDEVIAEAIP
jgi:uncharacterized protein with von Willebrand factor type A (vWA) domain